MSKFAGLVRSVTVRGTDEEVVVGDITGYLTHLEQQEELADYTIFLHPDFAEHIQMALWQRVWTAIGTVLSGHKCSRVRARACFGDVILELPFGDAI